MTTAHFNGLMPVVMMMGIAVLLFWGGHFVSVLLAPKKPSHLKSTPYECGEIPVGSAWSMFNVRFYVVGLIFIIFDVESVLLFPVATIFRELTEAGEGGYALIILLSFISVLIEGIAYCWKKGDLDWVKSYQVSQKTNK
ncbi:MAG TPA: NADH-quinone oxidoreductase subunit A [Bacteriovoracaceae bacterium]|nr:NADH-quinone oxidoreductase subunit A [Bacteriovoracaceae bacterium]